METIVGILLIQWPKKVMDCQAASTDSSGNQYWSFASRLQQAADFDSFILSLAESENRNLILKQSRILTLLNVLWADKEINSTISEKLARPLKSQLASYPPKPIKALIKSIMGSAK